MKRFLQPLPLPNGLSLPQRAIPGPMDGITEGAFLKVLSEEECAPLWFTPFIHISNGIPRTTRLRLALAPFLETGLPVIAQIMGTHTEILRESARKLHELGAICADLNCACPSKTVLSSGSGGALLKNPRWIAETIAAMKSACGVNPVSVKIRIGFDSPDELPDITSAIKESKPDIVFCHYRTVRESYAKLPPDTRRRRFATLRELLPDATLFASGDIFTLDDIQEIASLGFDGVLAARGFLKNPLILRQLRNPGLSLDEQEKWNLLVKIGQASNLKPNRWGFLLPIARNMFTADSKYIRDMIAIINSSSL